MLGTNSADQGRDPAADAVGNLTSPAATRGRVSSPRLAFRLSIAGALCLILFAVLGFRLWSLQLLSGSHYLGEANANRVRQVQIQPPRGRVLDRNGQVLVDQSNSLVVKLAPDRLPQDPAARDSIYGRLAAALHMPVQDVRRRVSTESQARPFEPATVKADVDFPTVAALLEHQDLFPGVTASRDIARTYPQGDAAAQLVGTIGQPNAKQLQKNVFPGAARGDFVGQAGVEYSYDRFLRGQDGVRGVQVDARGAPIGDTFVREPVPGNDVRVGIDTPLQRTAQQALGGRTGGFVVMDTTSGEVRALGSTPTYDPNIFSKAVSDADYARLSSPQSGAPLTNRATQGLYPTGSSFKLITAVGALQSGLIDASTPINDQGSLTVDGVRFTNFEGRANGPIAMRDAIKISDDVYFYDLGARMGRAQGGHLLQDWATKLGLGEPTGIDLPEDADGLVPSPEWRNRLFAKHQTSRPWGVGDNVNLAIGQGDLEADPLQLAVAYAAVANGGSIVTPHIGLSVENGPQTMQTVNPPERRKVDISPQNRGTIMAGMRAAASEPGGTTASVFGGFPIPVAGKTGTAQVGAGAMDQSWYAALVPYPNPRYVVVVTIEHGGTGEKAAAPAARSIISALFQPPPPPAPPPPRH